VGLASVDFAFLTRVFPSAHQNKPMALSGPHRPLKSSDDGVRQAKHMDLLAIVAVWESALSPRRGRVDATRRRALSPASALKFYARVFAFINPSDQLC
jgi:hypothetical protein